MTRKDYRTWTRNELLKEVVFLNEAYHDLAKEAGAMCRENDRLKEDAERVKNLDQIRRFFHGR